MEHRKTPWMDKHRVTMNDSNYDGSCTWRHMTSQPVHEFEDFRPLDFYWTECKFCIICCHCTQGFEIFHVLQLFLIYHNLYWGSFPWDSHYHSFSHFPFHSMNLLSKVGYSLYNLNRVGEIMWMIKWKCLFSYWWSKRCTNHNDKNQHGYKLLCIGSQLREQ